MSSTAAWQDEAGFEALKGVVRAELNDAVVEVAKQVEAVLTLSHEIKKRLKGKMQLDTALPCRTSSSSWVTSFTKGLCHRDRLAAAA